MDCAVNRWPPVYDFDSLQNEIKTLVDKGLEENFYTEHPTLTNFFQGDIIELDMDFPFIDENGDIAATYSNKWLILGNTCDISRDDLPYTNIIPLDELGEDVPTKIIRDLKNFQSYKKIFFPDISKESFGYVAEFTQICSIEKAYLIKEAKKISELKYHSWVLFHSCIVRYFARDDGRKE